MLGKGNNAGNQSGKILLFDLKKIIREPWYKVLVQRKDNGDDFIEEDQNYKGQLIEFCHCNGLPTPQFSISDCHGPEHEKTFVVNVKIASDQTWEGVGSTKKSAEQNCARNAMNTLLGS